MTVAVPLGDTTRGRLLYALGGGFLTNRQLDQLAQVLDYLVQEALLTAVTTGMPTSPAGLAAGDIYINGGVLCVAL